jgi:hypothetical protein
MKGRHSFGCLLFRDSVVVTDSSVRGSINDPTGCFWRTRSFENKHEEEGVVNWRLLPTGIDNQWVGFAAGRTGAYVMRESGYVQAFFPPQQAPLDGDPGSFHPSKLRLTGTPVLSTPASSA